MGLGPARRVEQPSAPTTSVWARDLYQVATALLRPGDRDGGASARSTSCSSASRSPTARSRRTRSVDGTPNWTSLQLDEVALPIVLAWQLGRTDARRPGAHVKQAADFIVGQRARRRPQERWENQDGYSPGTIAAEIAGLVCAADIARAQRRRRAGAARYEAHGRRLAAQGQGLDGDHERPVLARARTTCA